MDLVAELEAVPLDGSKKVVVTGDLSFLDKARVTLAVKGDDAEAFYDYLSNPIEDCDLYILLFEEEPNPKSKFGVALKKGGAKFHQVKDFDRSAWLSYIPSYLSKRGSDIEAAAAELLYERTGGDYALFLNEAEKLLAYANGETIALNNVEELVHEPLDEDAFHLFDAILAKDKAGAYGLLANLTRKPGQEVTLIHTLSAQFEFLLRCLSLSREGLSESLIASQLRSHPYRVKMSLRKGRGYDEKAVSKILHELYKAEKAIFEGSKKGSDALFLFIKEALA